MQNVGNSRIIGRSCISRRNCVLGRLEGARNRKVSTEMFVTFVLLNNVVFWDVTPCGSCKTDVSKEFSASIIR
jgi:hypothetical protein